MLGVMENKRLHHSFNHDEYTLIKTGTVGDGSCFFHSILTALSTTYRKSDTRIKRNYIKKFRKKISETFNISDWHTFPGMEMLVQNMIYTNIKNKFTNQISRDPNSITIRCICPFGRLDTQILPRAFDLLSKKYKQNVDENDYIEDLCGYIVRYIDIFTGDTEPDEDTEDNRDKETLEQPFVPSRWGACIEHRESVLDAFRQQIEEILRVSENQIFEKFKESVMTVSTWVDNDILVKHVSDMFKINIMILNSQTNEPYSMAIQYDDSRPYILLYYIPQIHFESIGVHDNHTNTIYRKFNKSDSIVKWFIDKMN